MIQPDEFWDLAARVTNGFLIGMGAITIMAFIAMLSAYFGNNKRK